MATWAQTQRLLFIEDQLRETGRINRREVVEKFGVTHQVVSSDLAAYRQAHPGRMRYDKSAKAWVSTHPVTPKPPSNGFHPGDVAYLKSGSGAMTVEAISPEGVTLVWMVYETKELKRATLPEAVLKKDYRP